MHAGHISGVASMLAFVSLSALAAGSETDASSNSSAQHDGVVSGSEKGKSDRPGRSKALAATRDKRAVEAATKAGSAGLSDRDWLRLAPGPKKNWDEMTSVEHDEARRRWLFSTGDFAGPSRGMKGGPVKSAKDKGATGNSAQKGSAPNEQLPER